MNARAMVKRTALHLLKACGMFMLARRLTRRKLRILCYHGFSIGDQHEFAPILFMRESVFRQRMALLRKLDCRVITLPHAVALLRGNAISRGEVVITIDDGWKSTLTKGVPVMMEYGLPSTLYVTTYYAERAADVFNVALRYMIWKTRLHEVTLAGLHPALDGHYNLAADPEAVVVHWISVADQQLAWPQRQALLENFCVALQLDPAEVFAEERFRLMTEAEIARCRHYDVDIQLHTHRHVLPSSSISELRKEVVENRELLERSKLASCTHLCYPSGLYTADHPQWLSQLGVDSATTCDPGLNTPDTSLYLLKRHLDRDDASNIEFEAEICGVSEIARDLRRWLTGSAADKAEPTLA